MNRFYRSSSSIFPIASVYCLQVHDGIMHFPRFRRDVLSVDVSWISYV